METSTDCYDYTPFGIICNICQYAISLDNNNVVIGLYQHEYRNEKHVMKMSPESRQQVANQFETFCKAVSYSTFLEYHSGQHTTLLGYLSEI